MGLLINADQAIQIYENTPGAIKDKKFWSSLRSVLQKFTTDKRITDVRQAAYLLGTASEESTYSLERWESDYACGLVGIPYGPGGPCEAALTYYRKTTSKKKNYYTLGVDNKGLPYFGRGLIQLTGKDNYKLFGEKLGLNLVDNADLALDPDNSYNIAVEYMIHKKTFTYVIDPNAKLITKTKNGKNPVIIRTYYGLEAARRSVNGGTNGIDNINKQYGIWKSVLNQAIKEYKPSKPTATVINSNTNQSINATYEWKINEDFAKFAQLSTTWWGGDTNEPLRYWNALVKNLKAAGIGVKTEKGFMYWGMWIINLDYAKYGGYPITYGNPASRVFKFLDYNNRYAGQALNQIYVEERGKPGSRILFLNLIKNPTYFPSSTTTTTTPNKTYYTVKSGDSFSLIASKNNLSTAELRRLNPNIADISKVSIGQKIRIK